MMKEQAAFGRLPIPTLWSPPRLIRRESLSMNRDDSFRILRETHRLGGALSSLADVHPEPVDEDASGADHHSYAATWYDAEEGPQAVIVDARTSQSHPVPPVGHPQLTTSER